MTSWLKTIVPNVASEHRVNESNVLSQRAEDEPRISHCKGARQTHQSRPSGRLWSSCASSYAPLRQKNHRVKPRFKTQCERVKPTVPFALLALPKARPKAVNRECYRNSGTERCLCASSTDTRNVHGVSLVRGSGRRPIAQNRIQRCFNEKGRNSVETVALGAIVRSIVQKDDPSFFQGEQIHQSKRSGCFQMSHRSWSCRQLR